jgi:hypothetical protein
MDLLHLFPRASPPPRRRASLACLGLFVAASLGLARTVDAADKARAASAPASKTSILTQAQLRDCMAQKDSLGQKKDAAVKSKAGIDAAKAEIERNGAAITEAQAKLDRTKKDDVDAFNASVDARNALIDDYEAKAAAYNKDVEDLHASQESYSSTCGNRRYDDRDLADIQRKK